MTYTWGQTNRWHAQAKASGDPSQLAFVAYLRGKLTARRNRSHAHRQQSDVPPGAHTEPHKPAICSGPSVGLPVRSVRAGTNAQAPAEDHTRDPAHEFQRYHVAAEILRHFGDMLDSETIAGLESIKEYYERRQPVEHVRDTVKRSLRRW